MTVQKCNKVYSVEHIIVFLLFINFSNLHKAIQCKKTDNNIVCNTYCYIYYFSFKNPNTFLVSSQKPLQCMV